MSEKKPTRRSKSQAHVAALRALLQAAPAGAVPATTPPAAPVSTPVLTPDWVATLPRQADARTALRYQPDAECFFKGEDPWRLATTAPGLLHLAAAAREAWPEGDALEAWDCYRCNLDIVMLSSAGATELAEHFRCVPEQVVLHRLPSAATADEPWHDTVMPQRMPHDAAQGVDAPADAPPLLMVRRAAALWADQLALLSRGAPTAGVLHACRRALQGLLCARDPAEAAAALQALPPETELRSLLDWARRHAPGSSASPAHGDAAAAPGAAPANEQRLTAEDASPDRQQRVLKVSQEKVDRLMDLIGEMVVAKNSLPYLAQRAEQVHGQREMAREIKAQYAVINRIAEDMQHAIMQVRMLPVGTVFQRFGRLVRDISRKLGKDVQMVVEGEDTEADKNVIEPLADPLIHILRNSLDHGIELPEVRRAAGKPVQGTIRIVARQEADRVLIEISDDGAGVNPARVRAKAVERGLIPADRAATLSDDDAVQLVFLPGFSTAESISDLSGRGVGMDVVRTAVERIGGAVSLASQPGRGTTIGLSLPLSMAVTNVMVIDSGGRRLGVPMDLIVETVRVHADDIHHFKGARTTVLRGRVVALRALNDLLALDAAPRLNAEGEYAVLVVRLAAGNVGLLVDHFHGASDIILKPLEGVLAGITGFAGTALLGDGSVLMVLNPKELI